MEAITFQKFQDMFRASKQAFHLELRDDYHAEDEEVPFEKWLSSRNEISCSAGEIFMPAACDDANRD